jgi:hypothetical protein
MHTCLKPKDDRCRRNGWLVAVCALLLAALGAGPARATSGDVLDLDGLYTITPQSCNDVRAKTNTVLDVIVPCSAEARADGGRVCDIVTASDFNIGLAVGQCQDSFPVPLSPPLPGAAYETNTQIKATTFGADTAYIPGVAGLSTDLDKVCNTFADGTNRCIHVLPGTCPPGGCPSCGIKAFSDPTCAEVRAQLQAAVTTTPPQLSHYLALDVQSTGATNYLAVGVCPSFKWVCADSTGPLQSKYYDELLFATVETPVCLTFNRKLICK